LFKPQPEDLSKKILPIQLTALYPKTREQKIKNFLSTQHLKKQIYYQTRQSTIAFLLERESTNQI